MSERDFYRKDDTSREPISVYSKALKAGKRTYFFDVKATRTDQYYLVITESKKRIKGEESFFEKHKIYLYGEDFENFKSILGEMMKYVSENTPEPFFETRNRLGDVPSESEEAKPQNEDETNIQQ